MIDDVPVHLFDMDRSQSTVTNINSSTRRRLSSHLQLCLVLFCKHPRRLHPHKFAFLEFKCQLQSFTKLCVHRPQIGTIGIVFASPCWFCNSVSRNSPKLDGCCWLFFWSLKISQVHALVGSSDWVKVLFIFWCPWQWKSIIPTTCSTNIYQIKSRTGKLFVYRFEKSERERSSFER